MPKIIRQLSAKEISTAKPGKFLQDGNGLMLLVDKNGNKRWLLRYTRPDGNRNMIGLGSLKETSISAARANANIIREMVAQGIDPVAAKKAEKLNQQTSLRGTFKSLAEEWYAYKAKGWASETARKAREVLDDYLYPKLADKKIADISTADFKPVLLDIHKHAPRIAEKAKQYCNQIIDYSIQEGLREDGRFLSLQGALPKSQKKHYAAVTRSNELPKLLKAINGIDSSNSKGALFVCLYTASRPGVVAGMRWDEIDLEEKEWHIPASRMKTSNDHITPLPEQLISMLKGLRLQAGDSPFVFPGSRNPNQRHIHRDSLSKVLRENGLQGVTVTHGFRATFRTVARERLKIESDVLEAQLAHAKKGEVQSAYDRTQFLEERHKLMQQWADYLDNLNTDAEVLPVT